MELTGIIAELAQKTLPREFRNIDTHETRVILVEAGPRVLPAFSPKLLEYATGALKRLGAEVRCGVPVTFFFFFFFFFFKAARWLDTLADRAGRVIVEPNLTVPGMPEIFAIGDTAHVVIDGKPVPGVAPAAKQEGAYVASVLRAQIAGRPAPGPFVYRHLGDLATVGRRAAVIDFGRIVITGWIAYWIWGIAHITP